ncbi:uncharacterized protein FIBRA_06732 [Fibroporia radiculosa]|uniref:Cytochrome P450 n=1 Tax=Fibroporia radiculosa TaxID=599839 RepID=J4IBF1_9APHY|nr:uncharacterized protein FIBRA_06732 [Fibroporia radiculosa]CCM04551.1 predicted protein [Fibroporia radiculosa]
MPGAGFQRRLIKVRKMTADMMNIPYERVKEDITSGFARPSFSKWLLEKYSQGGHPTPEEETEIKCAASLMYGAGSDTTMTALLSFVLAIVLHPDVLLKAQAETDRVIGNGRLPDYEDRNSLPYLECMLREIYRWNPPVPLGIPHRIVEDDEFRGFHIPGGSMIIANVWGMTRDPEMYADPEAFRPERFEEMDKVEADLKDPRRMVFGFGRQCGFLSRLGFKIWLAKVERKASALDVSSGMAPYGSLWQGW